MLIPDEGARIGGVVSELAESDRRRREKETGPDLFGVYIGSAHSVRYSQLRFPSLGTARHIVLYYWGLLDVVLARLFRQVKNQTLCISYAYATVLCFTKRAGEKCVLAMWRPSASFGVVRSSTLSHLTWPGTRCHESFRPFHSILSK